VLIAKSPPVNGHPQAKPTRDDMDEWDDGDDVMWMMRMTGRGMTWMAEGRAGGRAPTFYIVIFLLYLFFVNMKEYIFT
jgi:hypothetical protein